MKIALYTVINTRSRMSLYQMYQVMKTSLYSPTNKHLVLNVLSWSAT